MIEPDIRLVKGTWRDVLSDPERRAELGTFDAIYFDTFEEGYRSLLEFFSYVPGLMRGPGARMSFFVGLGRNDPVLAEVGGDFELTLYHSALGRRRETDESLCTRSAKRFKPDI